MIHADLVSKGYIVSHACRYGGDFVIYEAHPSVCHSSDTVRVLEPDECPSALDVAAYCRVQGSVLKRAVFATVIPRTKKPAYVGLTYNPALSTDNAKKVERRLSRLIVESPKQKLKDAAAAQHHDRDNAFAEKDDDQDHPPPPPQDDDDNMDLLDDDLHADQPPEAAADIDGTPPKGGELDRLQDDLAV